MTDEAARLAGLTDQELINEYAASRTALSKQMRKQLRSFAALVKPGETLVVLAYPSWTPEQLDQVNRVVRELVADMEAGFKVLFVPGTAFAVGDAQDEGPEADKG